MKIHTHDPSLRGVFVDCAIRCPTCAESAGSFRILRVSNCRGSIDAVFHHPTGACTGSMILSRAAALDLLRMAVQSFDSAPGFGVGAGILKIPAGTLVP